MNIENPKEVLFHQIRDFCTQHIKSDWITETKTIRGGTQKSEKIVVLKIREMLDNFGLSYQEASSQQPKDFRNVGGIGLDIEIKKTDSQTIYFNDTCPTCDIFYIILYTGKTFKKKQNIPAQLIFLNGSEFISDSPWISGFQEELESLKNRYARGENKKRLPGILSVYPRPTYKADISRFLEGKNE